MSSNVSNRPAYPKAPGLVTRVSTFLPLVIVLISNLIPLAGVLFWGWDTFVLLMLYWLETLIIAFWTLLRILVAADYSKSFFGEVATRLFTFAFFLVHSGGFMLGHFIFLWTIFGKKWSHEIPITSGFSMLPVEIFWDKMVIANGLLIPLAVSFVGRGVAFVIEMSKLSLWQRLVSSEPGSDSKDGKLVGGLYGRIIAMHIAILAGAGLAQKFGDVAPLMLLIAMKTVIDLWFFVRVDLRGRTA